MTVQKVADEVVCRCPSAGRNLTFQDSKVPPAPPRSPYCSGGLLNTVAAVAVAEAVGLEISASSSSGLKKKKINL